MYSYTRTLLALDAIRHSGNCIPVPPPEQFSEVIHELEKAEFIANDGECYRINRAGKRLLMLYDSERREMIDVISNYKEVLVDGEIIDARIPLASFLVKGYEDKFAANLLHTFIVGLKWDDWMNEVQQEEAENRHEWYDKVANNKFINTTIGLIDLDSWKTLGPTPSEAFHTAKWLLYPDEGIEV
jgi:hypothetical protein